MMPYDTYRLYQIERAKSPAEVRHADEQAARLAAAASSLFRGITRRWRAMRRPFPAATDDLPRPADWPACAGGKARGEEAAATALQPQRLPGASTGRTG
jgi:hypothetical protein